MWQAMLWRENKLQGEKTIAKGGSANTATSMHIYRPFPWALVNSLIKVSLEAEHFRYGRETNLSTAKGGLMGTNVKEISHVSQIVASAKSLEYKQKAPIIVLIRKVSFRLHGGGGMGWSWCSRDGKGKLALSVLNGTHCTSVYLLCHLHAY